MLADKTATAMIAVRDLERASRFYEDVLGLQPLSSQPGELITYRTGTSMVNVYRSEFAGTNQANALAWGVGDDLERIMERLREKGVTFEHYDIPGMTHEGDVHVHGDMRVAWFKDPDGNILHIVNK